MRTLLCTARRNATVAESARISIMMPSGNSYEIIEGMKGCTPPELQQTHVSEETALTLVGQDPSSWRIVDQAEIEAVAGRLVG